MGFIKTLLILAVLLSTMLAKGVSAASWLPNKFKVDYEIVNIDFITKKEISHEAELYYKYPNRIKLVEKKKKGKTIYVYNPYETYYFKEASLKGNPNELTIQKTKGNNLGSFFDSLSKNGLTSNKLYTVKRKGNEATITFTKEGVDKLGLKRATMVFKTKKMAFSNLSELSLLQENEKNLNFKKLKVSKNIKLVNEDFNFKTPDNTNIIRE